MSTVKRWPLRVLLRRPTSKVEGPQDNILSHSIILITIYCNTIMQYHYNIIIYDNVIAGGRSAGCAEDAPGLLHRHRRGQPRVYRGCV